MAAQAASKYYVTVFVEAILLLFVRLLFLQLFFTDRIPVVRLWIGDPLELVVEEGKETVSFIEAKSENTDAGAVAAAVMYCCHALMGLPCQNEKVASKYV